MVEQEAAPDPVDAVDAIELLERVRARARAVWMVLPDASEKGEVGGRGERGGSAVGTVGSESWRCSLRSVCRLFWNQMVTDRTSLRSRASQYTCKLKARDGIWHATLRVNDAMEWDVAQERMVVNKKR